MQGHLAQQPKIITGNFGAARESSSPQDVRTPNRRLDSWKEIAAFFDRDERTVKRWEKERSLPVHRLPGGSRGRVFAFSDELYAWMRSPESAAESVSEIANGADQTLAVAPTRTNGVTVPAAARSDAETSPSSRTGWLLAGAVVLLLAVGAAALFGGYRQHAAELRKSAATPAVNPEAEELYLKGRYYWEKRTPADLTQAVDYFTQAIVHDPNYAQAYVGLADCYNLLREFATMPSQEAFPRALAAAKKAVELDDSSAEAHASLAFVTFYWNWDSVAAEREFRRAIELNPNYVAAHHWYATSLMEMQRYPEALREIERAQELDPSSNAIVADKALILVQVGKIDEAMALLKQIESSQPNFSASHKYLSYIYLAKHDLPNYLGESRTAATLTRDENELAIVDAAKRGFKAGGERGMWQEMLKAQQQLYAEGKTPAFLVAISAARLGRKEDALRYLQASYQEQDPNFLAIRGDTSFNFLHDDPQFRKLLELSKLPRAG